VSVSWSEIGMLWFCMIPHLRVTKITEYDDA